MEKLKLLFVGVYEYNLKVKKYIFHTHKGLRF